jgi:hypothetical protein
MIACGRCRIDTLQQSMKPLRSTGVRNPIQSVPELLVGAGSRKEAPRQRSVVEPGPADEDWQPAASMDIADRGGGVAGVLRRRVNLGWVGDVDQMVRNAPSRVDGHLIRADVEAAVDGGRIAVDDLAVVPLGQRQAKRTLP